MDPNLGTTQTCKAVGTAHEAFWGSAARGTACQGKDQALEAEHFRFRVEGLAA